MQSQLDHLWPAGPTASFLIEASNTSIGEKHSLIRESFSAGKSLPEGNISEELTINGELCWSRMSIVGRAPTDRERIGTIDTTVGLDFAYPGSDAQGQIREKVYFTSRPPGTDELVTIHNLLHLSLPVILPLSACLEAKGKKLKDLVETHHLTSFLADRTINHVGQVNETFIRIVLDTEDWTAKLRKAHLAFEEARPPQMIEID